jgi:hypothetical protein
MNNKKSQEIQWEVYAVDVGENPTPRVFPAVMTSVRPGNRYDKSFLDTVTYTRGYVESRDDAKGKTFRPSMHVPDRLMEVFRQLEHVARTRAGVHARNADKQVQGKFAAPLGLVAALKGR